MSDINITLATQSNMKGIQHILESLIQMIRIHYEDNMNRTQVQRIYIYIYIYMIVACHNFNDVDHYYYVHYVISKLHTIVIQNIPNLQMCKHIIVCVGK